MVSLPWFADSLWKPTISSKKSKILGDRRGPAEVVKVIDWIAEIASEAPSLRDLRLCLCAEQSAIAREAGPRDFSLLIMVKREARIERIAGHLH